MSERATNGQQPISPGAVYLLLLAAIVIAGGAIRFRGLDAAGLWLDEILAVLRSQASPLSTAWTPGTDPQHGPLYHGLLALADKFWPTETGYRFPFALAGTLCLPLVYALARRVAKPGVALLTAGLLASSPVHVFESQDARPYTVLIFLLLAGLYAVLRLADAARDARWYGVYLASLVFLLLASSQGFWFASILLASYAVVLLVRARAEGIVFSLSRLGFATVLVLVLFPGLYGPIIVHQPDVIGPPPFSFDFVGRMFQPLVSGYSEQQPITWVIYPALVLAAIGAIVSLYQRPLEAGVIGVSWLLGFLLPFLLLYTVGHGVRARYTIAALPALALFVAAGALWLASPIERFAARWRDGRTYAALLVAIILTIVVWEGQQPAIAEAFGSRSNWRTVAKVIADRAYPGDLVVTSNAWPQVCLNFYLPRVGAQLNVQSADESVERARQLAETGQPAFLVSGGYQANFDALRWMREFPSIYRSRSEGIDVSFYPDADTLALKRPRRLELVRDENWLWTSLSGALIPGENGAKFLLSGWSALEIGPDRKGFRWIDGLQARAYVPVAKQKPKSLVFDAKAFGPIADKQRLAVSLNGIVIFATPLDRNWQHFDIDLSRASVQPGPNQVLFELTAAARPSDVTPGAPDGRNLSAAFQTLSIK